jgi:hypothetical protein
MSKSRRALQEIVRSLCDQLTQGWAALLVAQQVGGARQLDEQRSLDEAQREGPAGGTRSFLTTAHDACVESAILAFARLTIAHKDSISVVYLLNCVQQSPSAFPVPQRDAVMEAVSRHRALLWELRPLIDQVRDYRDRTIAHLDKRYVNHRDAVHSYPPIDLGEVGRAFALLLEVLNAHRGFLGLPELDLGRLESGLTGEWADLLDSE